MAGTTITGSVAGVNIAVNTSGDLQQGAAAQILSSAAAATGIVFKTASGALTGGTSIVSGPGSVVWGATSVPSASVLLNGASDLYIDTGTARSTVVAADNSNSTIISANPQGALVGVTGAGANLLEGLAKAVQFITGAGGQDLVFLYGTRNTLTSSGSDGVFVGGPSTVTATPTGLAHIVMTKGTTLSFVNGSAASAVDSITGAANGSVVVAGLGNTSVTAGPGAESFFIDTAAGNVTLTGNLHASDVFEFLEDGNRGANQTTIANFTGRDAVLLNGYGSYNVAAVAGNPTASVLSLSDGSQVTFTNATAETVMAAVKIH